MNGFEEIGNDICKSSDLIDTCDDGFSKYNLLADYDLRLTQSEILNKVSSIEGTFS